MRVRPAVPGDHAAIRAVNRAAFGGLQEVALVDALRRAGDVLAELVAEESRVVGHILFSRLEAVAEDGARLPFAALAPMAVLPEHQRRRVGHALVSRGLEAARDAGAHAVVVLGHPDYYPRFGFTAGAAERLSAPFSGPAFMALQLRSGALTRPLTLRYAPAFAALE